jgi:hypothetical protein
MMKTAVLLLAAIPCLAQPRTAYYLVEGTMQIPSGRNVGATVSLVKRTVDRERARIEERVLSLRGGAAAGQEFVTILEPKGNKVKISCDNCGIDGEGELSGEPWEWTGLKFTSKVPNAGRVEGEDHFSATGMSAEKRVLGADGKLSVIIKESGVKIEEATYEILHDRLTGK